jgi:hypothetical protein
VGEERGAECNPRWARNLSHVLILACTHALAGIHIGEELESNREKIQNIRSKVR